MKRVALVATYHGERGAANVSQLLAILERIRPEVIFLEIPSAAADDFFDGTRSNVETTAARRYRELHTVELVPVDLPSPEAKFFRDNRDLHDRVKRTSPKYGQLLYRHSEYVREYGFAYLNSEHCSKLLSDLEEATLAAARALGDGRMVELHELWRHTNELRDKAMVKHIRDYCAQHAFDRGAFLVGAAHRQSIIDKSREDRGAGLSTIQWDFGGYLDESNWSADAPHSS